MANESAAPPIGQNQSHQITISCPNSPNGQEVDRNGHCFKCIGNTKVCGLGVLSLLAIAGGSIILTTATPLAVDNFNRGNYWEMTTFAICDLAGACWIMGGGWKIVKIFCELKAANQLYPSGRFPYL